MAWTHLHEGQIKNNKVVILHGKIYGSRPYGKLMDRWIGAVNRNVRKMLETLQRKILALHQKIRERQIGEPRE
jgi:hypothetical protein